MTHGHLETENKIVVNLCIYHEAKLIDFLMLIVGWIFESFNHSYSYLSYPLQHHFWITDWEMSTEVYIVFTTSAEVKLFLWELRCHCWDLYKENNYLFSYGIKLFMFRCLSTITKIFFKITVFQGGFIHHLQPAFSIPVSLTLHLPVFRSTVSACSWFTGYSNYFTLSHPLRNLPVHSFCVTYRYHQ